jgi:hypothetical protein
MMSLEHAKLFRSDALMPVDRNPTIVMSADPPSQRALAETRLLTDAATLAESRKLSDADALEEAARLDPGNYRRLRGYQTGYLTEPGTDTNGAATAKFSELVDKLVSLSGMSYGDAAEKVAEKAPNLISAYRSEWSHV